MGNICRTSEVFARVRPAVLPASPARPSSALARRHRVSQFPPRHLSPRFPRRPGWLRFEPTRLRRSTTCLRRGHRRLFCPRRVLGQLPAIKTIAPGGRGGRRGHPPARSRPPHHPGSLRAASWPAARANPRRPLQNTGTHPGTIPRANNASPRGKLPAVELRLLTGRAEPAGRAASRRDKTPLGTIEGIAELPFQTQHRPGLEEEWLFRALGRAAAAALKPAFPRGRGGRGAAPAGGTAGAEAAERLFGGHPDFLDPNKVRSYSQPVWLLRIV